MAPPVLSGCMHSERQPRSVEIVSGDLVSDRAPFETLSSGKAVRYARSRQMVNALREEFLYSEKRVRDVIFRVLGGLVGDSSPPRIISRLTREAALQGRRECAETGFEQVNWDIAAKATLNAMLGAGSLLGSDGEPIRLTIASPAKEVVALVPDFVDRTEAHLLAVVIRALGDVTSRDHTALAHALFRQFDRNVAMEELEDRVAILLAGMADRIGLAKGGTYYPLIQLD
jgi:hypothetical protein